MSSFFITRLRNLIFYRSKCWIICSRDSLPWFFSKPFNRLRVKHIKVLGLELQSLINVTWICNAQRVVTSSPRTPGEETLIKSLIRPTLNYCTLPLNKILTFCFCFVQISLIWCLTPWVIVARRHLWNNFESKFHLFTRTRCCCFNCLCAHQVPFIPLSEKKLFFRHKTISIRIVGERKSLKNLNKQSKLSKVGIFFFEFSRNTMRSKVINGGPFSFYVFLYSRHWHMSPVVRHWRPNSCLNLRSKTSIHKL